MQLLSLAGGLRFPFDVLPAMDNFNGRGWGGNGGGAVRGGVSVVEGWVGGAGWAEWGERS